MKPEERARKIVDTAARCGDAFNMEVAIAAAIKKAIAEAEYKTTKRIAKRVLRLARCSEEFVNNEPRALIIRDIAHAIMLDKGTEGATVTPGQQPRGSLNETSSLSPTEITIPYSGGSETHVPG